ncbi:cytochrome P450 [Robbsia andropogonis]|uniref:cytochrome P450 n=1 Tax=Robbsia andropogonis TaxID=28092 RepID=UPI003D1E3EC9
MGSLSNLCRAAQSESVISYQRIPPGPKGGPVLGNRIAFSQDPLSFLLNCSREYGDVVRVAKQTYFVNRPDLIHTIFHNKDGTFSKTDPYDTTQNHSAFPASVMNSSGSEWADKRRKLRPAFQSDPILQSVEQASSASHLILASWRQEPLRFDVREDMVQLCMEIGSRFLFDGSADPRETKRVLDTVDAIMKLMRSPFRLPLCIPTPNNLRLRRSRAELGETIGEIVERYRRSPSNRVCLLGTMLSEGEHGDSAWVRDEMATMIMSGLEPLAAGLTWTLYLLASHAEIRRELQYEIDAVLQGHLLAASDISRLPFTEAVVKESLRLYPPAWMTGRVATRDCSLAGFEVPAGTLLTVSQWVSHRDPRYFESPDEYRPHRWLDQTDMAGLPSYAYFPFGTGPRKCIGSHLSMTQMIVVIASLMHGFDIEPVPDTNVRPYPALVLRPIGVRLRATLRRWPYAARANANSTSPGRCPRNEH